MSFGADPESPPAGSVCATCAAWSVGRGDDADQARKARVLCLECYRRCHPRSGAQISHDFPQPPFLRPTGGSGLTSDGIAHRRRMLAHLGHARSSILRSVR